MSETIEDRYLMVVADIEALRYLKFTHQITKEEVERIESLLSDLMAERKSVDLDTLFPKEVMEKAEAFRVFDEEKDSLVFPQGNIVDVVDGAVGFYRGGLRYPKTVEIVAYDIKSQWEELARVRVRVSLRVERVED